MWIVMGSVRRVERSRSTNLIRLCLVFERALLVTFAPNFKSDILTYVQ